MPSPYGIQLLLCVWGFCEKRRRIERGRRKHCPLSLSFPLALPGIFFAHPQPLLG
jgi:hypothetical protein